MDRDPSENAIDAEDRTTPATGHSDYGASGAQRARKAAAEAGEASDETPGNARSEEAGRGPGS